MTDKILIYKIALHAVFTWDLKLQDSYIEALIKAVRIMDRQTQRSDEILERMMAVFDKWQEQKINDDNLRGIYKDIEDILDEYELEETMEAEG